MEVGAAILGGGVAGLAAGYKLGRDAVVFEARDSFGGLCDHFTVGGFRFDHAVHLSFAADARVRAVFDRTPHLTYRPEPLNYCDGIWTRHPLQNNSYALPVDERVRIVKDFIVRAPMAPGGAKNYEEWLLCQYGRHFTERYPKRYTRKYWCREAAELTAHWIKNRMYRPSLDEVLHGAMTDRTPNTYYAQEMRYPVKGGFRAFLEPLAADLDLRPGYCAVGIDATCRRVSFANGESAVYGRLVSSLPLPTVVSLLRDCPEDVVRAAAALRATSVCLVSVGFNRPVPVPALWFYVYDEDVPFARAYAPGLKSPDNVPAGKSSLQFEIYYTKDKPLPCPANRIADRVLETVGHWGLAGPDDVEVVDVRQVEFANVIFDHGMERNREIVLDYLRHIGIESIGRFGEWDYLWSDQSFLSGYGV